MLQEHVEKAIALNPKDPTNYYLLGRWCYGVRTLDAYVAFRQITFLPHAVNCGRFCFWRFLAL